MVSCVVVDDDPDIVDLFCELLEMSNVEILAKGHDGLEAVDLYDKFQPDVIFTDLSMPNHDGIYAIKHIRSVHPNAKIIVLTGDSSDDQSHLLNTLKVDFILHKPFNMRTIRESITVALLKSSVQT